jgi:dolichol-phosphate mannosyltransferase
MGARESDAVVTPLASLVIPVYNEVQNLPILHEELGLALESAGIAFEVLYVDDGSTDGSAELIERLARADPRVRVVRLRQNSGQSAAFAAGFRFARGQFVVTLDADLQNDPADIPLLLREIADADVVCGVRQNRQDDFVRRLSSRIANAVRNRLTHEAITDVGCSLRACRREFVQDLPMFDGMHRFLPTLLRLAGATRVKEVPVHHRPRRFGTPKYNIRNRLWRALADLFAVRWMQRRWIDRRRAEEISLWTKTPSGSPSASSVKPSSPLASSSSGSPPSGANAA